MKTDFVKIGGVCAILSVVFSLTGIILSVSSGVVEDPNEIQAYLTDAYNNLMYSAYGWFWIIGLVLMIPAVLGFYQVLREISRFSLLALAFFFVGLATTFASIGIFYGIELQLMPEYASASADLKPTLEIITSTLLMAGLICFSFGFSLSYGIGIVFFSLGVIRSPLIRNWIGWFGIIAGVLIAFILGSTQSDIINYISTVGLMLVLVWVIVMGVSLLRLNKPLDTSS